MNRIKQLLIILMGSLVLSACSLVGINMDRTAPKRAAKYPKFTQKDSLKGYLNANRACFDVNFYRLDVAFNIPKKSISGEVDIHFIAVSDFNLMQIDLYENMEIDGIWMGDESLEFDRIYDAVNVKMPQTVLAGENKILTVKYHGKPQKAKKAPWDGGFDWDKDKSGEPWVGVACELDGASLWWPLKDHLTDEPDSAQMEFTVPQGLFCVSNGQLVKREIRKAETETFIWKVNNPINHYNITFYIGRYRTIQSEYVRESDSTTHQLTYYVQPENVNKAKTHFQQTNDMIQFYEKTFGNYLWFNDGYKLVESPYAGMEHQTAIAYGNGYKNNYNGFDYIILHETAHEWWGNAVTVADFADVWIHEGLATYSEALYVESTQGKSAYLKYLYLYSVMIKNKKPMVGPRDVKYWNYHDSDPYMKGALMMHSLRSTIDNDSIFFDVLRTFYAENQKQIVNSNDFIEVVNRKTQSDYQWFFNQFLYNRKPPRFRYALVYNYDKGTIVLNYQWEDVADDFKMPLDVYINKKMVRIYPTAQNQEYDLPKHSQTFSVDLKNFYFTAQEQNIEDYIEGKGEQD